MAIRFEIEIDCSLYLVVLEADTYYGDPVVRVAMCTADASRKGRPALKYGDVLVLHYDMNVSYVRNIPDPKRKGKFRTVFERLPPGYTWVEVTIANAGWSFMKIFALNAPCLFDQEEAEKWRLRCEGLDRTAAAKNRGHMPQNNRNYMAPTFVSTN